MAIRQCKDGEGWELTCQKCHKKIAGPYSSKEKAKKMTREGYDYFCVMCASIDRIEEQGIIIEDEAGF